MDHIGPLLRQVLHKRGLAKEAEASLLVHHAKQWIREQLPGCEGAVIVKSWKDGVLRIGCANAAVAQECRQNSAALERYLRETCGHDHIETIRLESPNIPEKSS